VWTLRAALETGVIAGGIISGALFALVIPLSAKVTAGGLPLLIALVYPIADVALITILLTQLITGRKPRDRRSALLVGGLVALAAVDISLPFGLGGGGYAFSTLQDVVWAIALAMLAAGASRPSATTKRSGAGIGPPVAVAAALCALVVLATNSGPALTWLIRTPAVLTLVLSLGLLLSSLRDARLAIEAQRLSRTDDLTGLGNRRAVMGRLAAAEERPLALMLIDLNGFKAVNDTF
jgi:predicted signal transduction protein with EAL and GGDEF domain